MGVNVAKKGSSPNNRDLLLSSSEKANDYHAHSGSSFKIMPFRSVKYAEDFTDDNKNVFENQLL